MWESKLRNSLHRLNSIARRLNDDEFIRLLEKGRPSAKLVDLGCGSGQFTLRCADRIATSNIWGVDVLDECLVAAETKGIVAVKNDLNKLLKLYVVDAMNLYELYSYDFSRSRIFVDDTKPTYSNDVNNSLNSIGVVGISDVFDEITKTYQNRVKTIKYGKFSILLEYEEDPKSQFLFVLFVDTDMKSLELFLKKVKNQFLTTYKSLLTTYDIVERFRESLFSSFDLVLEKLLD